MDTTIILALVLATQSYHLPQGLLSAVCYVESHHKYSVIRPHDGKGSSIGGCQVKLATAQFLGFKGVEEDLLRPNVNAVYAAAYLRYQLDRYDGDIRKAISAYNAGTFKEGRDGKTFNREYVRKVFNAWSENK